MTNTDTADAEAPSTRSRLSLLPARSWSASRSTTKTPRRRSGHRRGARKARPPRPHHRRLPLQRPHPAQKISGHGPRAGQVPHQSRQRLHRPKRRRQLPHHDRVRRRKPEARAHRRQLGLARSVAAYAHDGREQQPPRSAARARRDDGSDDRERARFRRRRRALRPAATIRSSSPPRSPAFATWLMSTLARRPLRLSAPPGPYRSGHGRQGPDRLHRRPGSAAVGRHRRHHPRQPDAQARRRPHRRGAGRAADSSVALHPQLHAAGDELPRLRPNNEHLFPAPRR